MFRRILLLWSDSTEQYLQSQELCSAVLRLGYRMDLAEFLEQFMERTGLTAAEIERRSGYAISDAYIGKILKRKVKRPSLVMLQALAKGAGLEETVLLSFAGVVSKGEPDPWPAAELLHAMQKIVRSKDLTELVKLLLRKKPAEVERILKTVKK